ncbi:uncharacterized protein LJ206_018974 [Theristicus caerulescens]
MGSNSFVRFEVHLHSYHKIYISVWHGALGRAGSGDEEQSEALCSRVPAEGHPRSGPARLPCVPSTPALSWVPCGSPRLAPQAWVCPPLKSGLCPTVVPSSAAWGGLGLGWRWGDGCDGLGSRVLPSPPVQRAAGGHGQLPAVAGDIGVGEPCPRHPCHSSAGAQPRLHLFLPGEGGGGGGSPGPPGSPGHPVPSPSQVLCQQRWRGLTLPSSGCFTEPGPPLSPALSPCPCALRAAAPGVQPPPPVPQTRGTKAPLAITLASIRAAGDLPGFVPRKLALAWLGGGGSRQPESHQLPRVEAGGLEAAGCSGVLWGRAGAHGHSGARGMAKGV